MLLLDEPTAGLDRPAVQKAVRQHRPGPRARRHGDLRVAPPARGVRGVRQRLGAARRSPRDDRAAGRAHGAAPRRGDGGRERRAGRRRGQGAPCGGGGRPRGPAGARRAGRDQPAQGARRRPAGAGR
nr:hypothetical protein [Angustibacter aerolatus]